MPGTPLPFEQIVFSGGGLRCFWHGGWMAAVEETCGLTPARVTGSSGGALSAAAWLADREDALRERFTRALREQAVNVTLTDVDDDDGRTPHQRLYETIVADTINPGACARIADGPVFQISVSTPGGSAAPLLRALAGGAIYEVEQAFSPIPRPRLSSVTGMEQRLIDANRAARDGTLVDLIRMAATVPPAFRPEEWDGEHVFDGGMVDKAPLPEPDRGPTLVLLTKRFHALPDDDGGRITFVEPSEDVLPGAKLDFTDPDLPARAWAQGRADGLAWRDAHIRT
ncbi:patatin-like phospholipase family protein [uncultured Jannaschia sp.]|uniref:patatin-like phospholipase family protein n=1 Tax=uncultured Jannaschia sp. TaxID=293347 RepID=UPI002636BB63|nr:patatin-like phospholipase family protein [uncultured Jannaschia sp.]